MSMQPSILSKWNKTTYGKKKSSKPTMFLTSPAYKVSNLKLQKMYAQHREKIMDSLLRDNKFINQNMTSDRLSEMGSHSNSVNPELYSTASMINGMSDTTSILNVDKEVKKMMTKKQLLSLEVCKKILTNIPGVVHEGEPLPLPNKRTLRRLHNSQSNLSLNKSQIYTKTGSDSPPKERNLIGGKRSVYEAFIPKKSTQVSLKDRKVSSIIL